MSYNLSFFLSTAGTMLLIAFALNAEVSPALGFRVCWTKNRQEEMLYLQSKPHEIKRPLPRADSTEPENDITISTLQNPGGSLMARYGNSDTNFFYDYVSLLGTLQFLGS